MQFEEALPVDEGTNTYLSTKFALTNADGQPYAVCTIATDITYRKMTETQLLLRNQAIEYSPSGISIADASLPDMPLIYINPAFEENTGYTALDAIGRNCRFLQADDRDQPEIAELREAIEKEETCTVVLRNYRKDGELFYNELSLAPIHNAEGELTHYVGISTDVTDRVEAEEKIQSQNQALLEANHELAVARKRTEEAARQITEQNEALVKANRELAVARRQAEEATRLKSQFLATMSHELRTPLNAIIGYTEIQLAGMTGDLTDEQHDYQERVLANADHLLDLINDVLDIAKIEAGRMEMLNKAFEVRVLLDDIVDQMQVLTDEKGLSLDVSLDERMPEKIIGDAARIRQITINLLSNAIKFTEKGTVRLQVRKHGRDAWKLIVSDDGVGIPSHMQETIFEEFRQVDGSSQRKAGGTGLGLSIVRKLALMMGGNVRLKSRMGEGSTFTIFLPLVEKSEKSVAVSDT
jgi:PAS domain S-box-containing protein